MVDYWVGLLVEHLVSWMVEMTETVLVVERVGLMVLQKELHWVDH